MDNLTGAMVKEALGRFLYWLPCLPSQVQIEITNVCNLGCLMCPRQKLGVPLEHMPWERFCQIVSRLSGVKTITLTGWGEPFLHPDVYRMVELCRKLGFYTQITTNGLAPGFDAGRIIASDLDALTFSVDSIKDHQSPGHANEIALKNIEQVLALRQGGRPLVSLQAILHRGRSQDIYDVIAYAASVGADRVNLGRLDARLDALLARPGPEEEREIFLRADALGRVSRLQVDIIQYAVSRGTHRHLYKLFRRGLHQFGRYCLKTYNYCYVNISGEVTPCCVLPRYPVGDILKEDLASIWQGEKFRYFRRHQLSICGRCDLWSIKYLG